jgi:hypothetical protein
VTRKEQFDLINGLNKKLSNISASKSHDYAGEDVLSNFKSVSSAAKALEIDVTTPSGYALFMVIMKIARISNLSNSDKTPNFEGLYDSFEDGINYFKLAYCCKIEERNQA